MAPTAIRQSSDGVLLRLVARIAGPPLCGPAIRARRFHNSAERPIPDFAALNPGYIADAVASGPNLLALEHHIGCHEQHDRTGDKAHHLWPRDQEALAHRQRGANHPPAQLAPLVEERTKR